MPRRTGDALILLVTNGRLTSLPRRLSSCDVPQHYSGAVMTVNGAAYTASIPRSSPPTARPHAPSLVCTR